MWQLTLSACQDLRVPVLNAMRPPSVTCSVSIVPSFHWIFGFNIRTPSVGGANLLRRDAYLDAPASCSKVAVRRLEGKTVRLVVGFVLVPAF